MHVDWSQVVCLVLQDLYSFGCCYVVEHEAVGIQHFLYTDVLLQEIVRECNMYIIAKLGQKLMLEIIDEEQVLQPTQLQDVAVSISSRQDALVIRSAKVLVLHRNYFSVNFGSELQIYIAREYYLSSLLLIYYFLFYNRLWYNQLFFTYKFKQISLTKYPIYLSCTSV